MYYMVKTKRCCELSCSLLRNTVTSRKYLWTTSKCSTELTSRSKTKSEYLVIAWIDPAGQLVYGLVQPGLVLLHVPGSLRVTEVVNEVRADLQPPAHVLLQHLLVKIVHVVIFLHRFVAGSELPRLWRGGGGKLFVSPTSVIKQKNWGNETKTQSRWERVKSHQPENKLAPDKTIRYQLFIRL